MQNTRRETLNDCTGSSGRGAYRFCGIGLYLFIIMASAPMVTAADTMFHANPLHTGVFDNGGIVPVNTSAWYFATEGLVSSSPAVVNGIVYFGSDDKNLYAIDAGTGKESWRFASGGPVTSSPAVANGIVCFGSNDRNLYAVDAGTGTERWRFATAGAVSSSPTIRNGVVYIGSDDDRLYAIDTTTGKEKWAFATGSDVSSSPAVADGVVFVGSNDKNLYAIDAGTGKEKWRFRTRSYVQSSPAVANGIVSVGSNDNYLYGVDAATGTEKWRFATGGAVTSSPAVANGIAYVGSQDTNLYAIDAGTGKEKWRYATGSYISSSPSVANGVVYVGSLDGNLYAVDAGTGREKWRFAAGSGLYSSPAVATGVVYVGSYDKNLYAVGGMRTRPEPAAAVTTASVLTPAVTITPDPCLSPSGCGPDLLIPALIALLVFAGSSGYYVFRSGKKKGDRSRTEPERTAKLRPSPPPGHGPGPEPVRKPEQKTEPGPVRIAEPPPAHRPHYQHQPPIIPPDPELNAILARIESTQKMAMGLAEFRNPVDNLLSLAHECLSAKRYPETRKVLDNAKTAIDRLRDCESQYSRWKKQGYDTTRLEAMRSEELQKIQSAFVVFGRQVDELEKIRSDLETLKKRYPALMSRAEFLPAVAMLEQSLKNPDHVAAARSEFLQLRNDTEDHAKENERLGLNLKNQVARIQAGISDESLLREMQGIRDLTGEGDFPAADRQFRELVSRRSTRVNETYDSLKKDGVIIPVTLTPVQQKTGDTEYAERFIEITKKQKELDNLRELFKEASALKERVTDTGLLSLFNRGDYEQCIAEYHQKKEEREIRVSVPISHEIIISYSSKDKSVADAVCAGLESQQIRCWIAPRDILPGEIFQESIIDAIDTSSIMVVIFSSHANISPHVISEVTEAMDKGVIIIPFRIEDILPTRAMKYLIGSSHWLDAITPPLEKHIRELGDTIGKLLKKTRQ